MYTVEDELFEEARAILHGLAAELRGQEANGEMAPIHIRSLIRRATADTPAPVLEGEEVDRLGSIADRLDSYFPVAKLFPSTYMKRATGRRDEADRRR
jgi:hypothetical protein